MKHLITGVIVGAIIGLVANFIIVENKPTPIPKPPIEIPRITPINVEGHTYLLGFYENKGGITIIHFDGCTNKNHIMY